MNSYNRIPISTQGGKALLEYRGNMCRVTLQLQGIPTDRLCNAYLLWRDTYIQLPVPLNVQRDGRCNLRCEVRADNPKDIGALGVISQDLQPVWVGYTKGEYPWQRCFMAEEAPTERADKSPEASPEGETREVFKSIVCRLSEDLQELKEYGAMPSPDDTYALFNTHEAVNPFHNSEGQWIRINIRELALVGSLWRYINNPLVVYACRRHHHLLLGKQGEALYLGVPWDYRSDYRLEAEIQGFKEIRPIEDKPLKEGDMCYLLMNV